MGKPILDKEISLKDFNDFYWLKKELVQFCLTIGISSTGGKIEISDRIRTYLSTGEIVKKVRKTHKVKSDFDWTNEVLTKNTVITDSYKNGENARNFFIREIGSHFKFNVIFMKWMKENIGKTLGDAIMEWKRIEVLKKDRNYVSEISPQFEYNRYMREFLKDNPNLSSKDAMKFWKLKSSQRGSNEYDKKDLELK
ncbi:MAG: hypothetical protein CSB55_04370 [Candidatus Cloacimonadota bacterium]|nr:MAG: hypothetical protein CSB55_04370 [Candidatus Cloacimonadota bacterium]